MINVFNFATDCRKMPRAQNSIGTYRPKVNVTNCVTQNRNIGPCEKSIYTCWVGEEVVAENRGLVKWTNIRRQRKKYTYNTYTQTGRLLRPKGQYLQLAFVLFGRSHANVPLGTKSTLISRTKGQKGRPPNTLEAQQWTRFAEWPVGNVCCISAFKMETIHWKRTTPSDGRMLNI